MTTLHDEFTAWLAAKGIDADKLRAGVARHEVDRGVESMKAKKKVESGAYLVYLSMVTYLVAKGWRREELGSGWWWKNGFEEATTGGAVEQQLDADNIDQRDAVMGEPEEFWG